MIVRAALTFGLVWLLAPHHAGVGPAAPVYQSGDSGRDAVFARLDQVRGEIEAQRTGHGIGVLNQSGEDVPQATDLLPELTTSTPMLTKAWYAARPQS